MNIELEKLANQLKEGKIDALQQIYEILSKSVYLFAFSILRSKFESEDIMQNTFIKIKNNISQYKENTNFKNWVITITKNFCLNQLKKNARFTELNEDLPSKENFENQFENKIILKNMLNTLDVDERQIVMLYALQNFKHKEIAQILNIPLGTELWKYNKALKKLKSKVEEEQKN